MPHVDESAKPATNLPGCQLFTTVCEHSSDLLGRMPRYQKPDVRTDLKEHLASVHRYPTPSGDLSQDLCITAPPFARMRPNSKCDKAYVAMAPFYVMTLLDPAHQGTPLSELVKGQSVTLNARVPSPNFIILQPEVLTDTPSPRYDFASPALEQAVGQIVRNGFENRFLPRFTSEGATALFVGVLLHRWKGDSYNPTTTRLCGVNVYARIDTDRNLTFASKVFEIVQGRGSHEPMPYKAAPLGAAHRSHIEEHLAATLEASKGLNPWDFHGCLLNGWAPGT